MTKNNKSEDIKQAEMEQIKFSKEQLVSSKKYESNRDLLQTLLDKDKSYTLEEVEEKIYEFKKRRV